MEHSSTSTFRVRSWPAYLLIGLLFTMGGLLVWRKRYAPEAP